VEALVEISSIDLRYEGCRQRNQTAEHRLLRSIAEEGIRDALWGATLKTTGLVLLDGFKRLRCAKKLSIQQVPFRIVGDDEASGIITLMRQANARSLTLLEQARLIEQLRSAQGLSVAEISRRIERSAGWVSMRTGLLKEMPSSIADKIMRGEFPAYAYMYTLRHFMRMKGIQPAEIEDFVSATAGRGLSVRDVSLLASGYFKGGEELRREIQAGNTDWCLNTLRASEEASSLSSDAEKRTMTDLEISLAKMRRLVALKDEQKPESPGFFAQAHLICGGLLRLIPSFTERIRHLYDRSRPEKEHRSVS
jgi:hypothetical protein